MVTAPARRKVPRAVSGVTSGHTDPVVSPDVLAGHGQIFAPSDCPAGLCPASMATEPIKSCATVDARGLRCPLPALRLARVVREGGAGCYTLLADDPAAQADIPALCNERGWLLLESGGGTFMIEAPNH